MLLTKYQLKEGQRIKMQWKGKIYCGIIKKINPQQWAQRTGGRFVAIDIITEQGHIIGMPYTSRAKYELIEYKEKTIEFTFIKNNFS